MFGIYALGFWYGGTLIRSGEMEPGNVLTVFFSIVIGAMGIGQAAQVLPDIIKAKAAASLIFSVIDREPIIAYDSEGKIPKKIKGNVTFKNINFSFPSRSDVQVLHDININIKAGQKVALVGPSGSGKSTIIQLIERFYDPSSGSVELDGKDIRDLDLKWFRSNIGLVSQEPILFSGTISENIRFGIDDCEEEDVIAAAKAANAYKFIMKQPQGFDTLVGEKGTQLSGGQKQRVAIARALLKNPKILLLDEATSALDAESESLVQEALERLMEGRTTLVIAHRLTTVRHSDNIYVINQGKVVEEGNHDELIEKQGFYAKLVKKQMQTKDGDEVKIEKKKEKW